MKSLIVICILALSTPLARCRGLAPRDPDVNLLSLNDIRNQHSALGDPFLLSKQNPVTPRPMSTIIATVDSFLSSPLVQSILSNETINSVLSDSMVQGVLRNPTVQSVLNNPIVQSILRHPEVQGITLLQTVLANIPQTAEMSTRPSVIMSVTVPARPTTTPLPVVSPSPRRPLNAPPTIFGVVLSGIDELLRVLQSQIDRRYRGRRNGPY